MRPALHSEVLYISDLDGTLLLNDASLSASSRATLTELLLDGLPFSIATARSVASIQMILKDLPITLPVVSFNGAFLSDLRTGRHEVVNALDASCAQEIYHVAAERGLAPIISTFDGSEDCLYFPGIPNIGVAWYHHDRTTRKDPRVRPFVDPQQHLSEQVVCLTVIGQHAPLAELDELIRESTQGRTTAHLFENWYSPGWHWLTIHDRRATKGQGVDALRTRYGFADADLVVFGDDVNDEALFSIATCAVAVENASRSLAPLATCWIGSNEDDSVANYVRQDWRSRRESSKSDDLPQAAAT